MADHPPEILFAVEGERNPRSLPAAPDSTITEFIAVVVRETGRGDLVEVLVEDQDEPLAGDQRLAELLKMDFKLIHVASKGHIKVKVLYATREVEREFKPSATMERIIKWAISPKELNLEGGPEDFQLKDGNEVLPADAHLGQVAKGHKHVTLTLVFKVKPQG